MKTLLLILTFLPLSLFAETCDSLNMAHEREKINKLNHLPSAAREDILSLKRKVKQAQVYQCIDRILAGGSLSMDANELRIAEFYLNSLEGLAQTSSQKAEILDIKEQLAL